MAEDKYSPGHSKCRESLICMINKKLSKNIAIALTVAVLGIPSVFILYGMAAEKKQNEKVSVNDKQIQSFLRVNLFTSISPCKVFVKRYFTHNL